MSRRPRASSTSPSKPALNLFDSADAYSGGLAEEILGKALKGRRDKVLISTKATFRTGPGPNDVGSSRQHLFETVEASLRRLGTDHIDLYQLHAFDALTPIEEALGALDDLVRAGKIRYVGCSNFSGWHLMKSLAIAEARPARYVAHQAYYSLVGREYEWELMPLAVDQRVGTVVWSPLGWGRLTGKIRRGQPLPETSRLPTHGGRRRPARPRRASLPRGRRARRRGQGDGQDRPPDRTQLAARASHRRHRRHRARGPRSSFGRTSARWAAVDAGPGRAPRRGERRDADLSVLASGAEFADRNPPPTS